MILYTWDGAQVSTEDLWERFIEHLHEVQPCKSGLPHKNFIGSIESYKKIFLQAQE